MRCFAFVALLLLLAPLAWADVVYLKTGGTISGTVVKESAKEVVVKTPDGKVTLPRHMIKEVVRQTTGQTLLALARERAKAGAYADAERLYLKAAEDPDAEIAAAARRGLRAMKGRIAGTKKHRVTVRNPWPLPEGVSGLPIEGDSLQIQFDRARRAIEAGDGGRALRLLRPLLDSKPDDSVLGFLVGRAHELSGAREEAKAAYLEVTGARSLNAGRPAEWLCEIARRKLSPEPLGSRSPGVGKAWRRIETRHFAVYHTGSAPSWVAADLERALVDCLEVFELEPRRLFFAGRILVFLFDGPSERRERVGRRPMPHAQQVIAPDGAVQSFSAYAEREFFRREVRHQVAHAVVADVFPDLAPWAAEGAARFAQPLDARRKLREGVAVRRRAGTLAPHADLWGGALARGTGPIEQQAFDGHALAVFESLVGRLRVKPAFKLCLQLARDGEGAFERFGLTPEEVAALVDKGIAR